MSQASLQEELRAVIGNRRRFILLRIVDIDPETARKLCSVSKGTYNSWLKDSRFTSLYRRRDEFSANFKQDAIRLLRRANQLQAVLLEEKIIAKMKEEIESGEYSLIKSLLARDVYSRLISDLDYQPQNLALSWEQRIAQLITGQQPEQLPQGGEVIEAEAKVITTDDIEQNQHQKSINGQVSS